jgi:glycerophosphoryl diester phosphodiesterase
MASFAAAAKVGIPGIELDVHLTADRRLAVFHDDTTARICGENFSIEKSDFALLSSLDIGSWKGEAFSGERMPTLDVVLEAFGRTCYFDIEIKSKTVGDQGLEDLLAEKIRKFGMDRRCIVSSFNPFALRRFKKLMPDLATAIIWSRSDELYWFLRRGEGRWIGAADALKPEHSLLKRRRLLENLARPILPWTVDSEEEAARVLSLGAIGLISNCPQKIKAWRRGTNLDPK